MVYYFQKDAFTALNYVIYLKILIISGGKEIELGLEKTYTFIKYFISLSILIH